jgi:hypothetical protein
MTDWTVKLTAADNDIHYQEEFENKQQMASTPSSHIWV